MKNQLLKKICSKINTNKIVSIGLILCLFYFLGKVGGYVYFRYFYHSLRLSDAKMYGYDHSGYVDFSANIFIVAVLGVGIILAGIIKTNFNTLLNLCTCVIKFLTKERLIRAALFLTIIYLSTLILKGCGIFEGSRGRF